VRENLEVVTRELPIDEAKALGAMALFGEKYGDIVRVVDIGGPWSRELCAGTHVTRSAEIGMINIIGESSVGASNRRVESLVGQDAFRRFAAERMLVQELTSTLKTRPESLVDRVGELVTSLKAAEKKIQAYEAKALNDRVPELAAKAERTGAVLAVVESVGRLGSGDELRSLATAVRARLGDAASVVALIGEVGGKPLAIAATSPAARDAGANAGALAKAMAGALGGGGGGKPDLAQGGGNDVGAIPAALSAARSAIGG
jgi:alanyl-tRNA synthetase